jgi:hypothetical protein
MMPVARSRRRVQRWPLNMVALKIDSNNDSRISYINVFERDHAQEISLKVIDQVNDLCHIRGRIRFGPLPSDLLADSVYQIHRP